MEIKDFCDSYAESGVIRGHMPGHKGRGEPFAAFDITEISGADSLYSANGIIAESEKETADIFRCHKSLFSAGGSTLCIQTMIALCIRAAGVKKIAAARNCHRAFISACAMLDVQVVWICPQYDRSIISGALTARSVEEVLSGGDKFACVYITSPDYPGLMAPVSEISEICRKYNVPLAVDNAHGAYLRFVYDDSGVPLHPVCQGADICCDSAHKTLPVLTGGAYLHINEPALERYDNEAKDIMSLFGSSSPSYLILRSLDMCTDFMKNSAAEYFSAMCDASLRLKSRLSQLWNIYPSEPGKLTICAPDSGLYGYELADKLREKGLECEYADDCFTVIMLTGLTVPEIDRIGSILETIRQPRILLSLPRYSDFSLPPCAMSIRRALMSPWENICIDDAAGRICALSPSACPPGVAPVVSGEIIYENTIKILKSYRFFRINVVK